MGHIKNIRYLMIVAFMFFSLLFTYTFLLEERLPFIWGINIKTQDFDLNNFSKMLMMVFTAIVMFCTIILSEMRDKSKKYLYLLLIFGVIFIIPYLFVNNDFKDIIFIGYSHRYEGLVMWVSYGVFLVYILLVVETTESIIKILKLLGLLYLFVSIIGFAQYFGFDILKTDFVRAILSPPQLWAYTIELRPSAVENVVYSTLANPNYASFMFSMLLPFTTYCILVTKKEKINMYLLWAIFFFCLIGSKSRGGFLGFVVAVTCALFFINRLVIYRKDRVFKLISISVICLFPNISAMFSEMKQVNLKPQYTSFSNIMRDSDGILFEKQKNAVHLRFDKVLNEIVFEDNGQLIDYYSKEGVVTLEYPYNTFEFINFEDKNFGYCVGNHCVKIVYRDGDYYALNPYGMLVSTWDPEINPLISNERFGTGRGYIWSRSLPLLKDTIWIGKGPDSFTYYFPQEDILGKSTGLGNPYIIVDKPHSSYIQIAHSFGIIFAIFFFGAFIAYAVYAMKLTQLKEPTTIDNYIIAIGFSMIAFLVSALFYDLSVHVTPTVILMLGIGIVLLRLRKEEQQAKDVETAEMALELEG